MPICADCELIGSEYGNDELGEERDISGNYTNSQLSLRCFYCSQKFQYR